MRDDEDARDTAQEIFIKMYRHLNEFRDGHAFLPWMLRLARNCCIDRIRSRQARPQDQTAATKAVDHASRDASPEESLLEDARRALFYRALATLTATSREIVLLKDIQEMRISEISTRLGLPLGTVKSRSNRARSELAKAVRSLESAAEVVS
jgi:RNA polymerase sigma-70 factor (ECF subfamily)